MSCGVSSVSRSLSAPRSPSACSTLATGCRRRRATLGILPFGLLPGPLPSAVIIAWGVGAAIVVAVLAAHRRRAAVAIVTAYGVALVAGGIVADHATLDTFNSGWRTTGPVASSWTCCRTVLSASTPRPPTSPSSGPGCRTTRRSGSLRASGCASTARSCAAARHRARHATGAQAETLGALPMRPVPGVFSDPSRRDAGPRARARSARPQWLSRAAEQRPRGGWCPGRRPRPVRVRSERWRPPRGGGQGQDAEGDALVGPVAVDGPDVVGLTLSAVKKCLPKFGLQKRYSGTGAGHRAGSAQYATPS